MTGRRPFGAARAGIGPLALALAILGYPITVAGQEHPVNVAAIETLLAALDQDFGAGDIDAYVRRFEPDHAGATALLAEHLQRLCTRSAQRERRSQLVAAPRTIGPRIVVHVRHELRFDGVAADAADGVLVEHTYLALRSSADGGVIPTFAIEAPGNPVWVPGDRFRCPACNYEIGGVDGWLCVPLRCDRTSALESVSFYLLGTDVACDLSVHVVPEALPATQVVQQLAAALQQYEPRASAGPPAAWLPPVFAASAPAALEGARLAVAVPGERADDDCVTVFHAITLGALQHLLLARGSRQSLREHQREVDALIKSYTMLEVDCNVAAAAARPLRHHTGGDLDGADYHNALYGVELHGPAGWNATMHAGGYAFRVVWTSRAGGRLWLLGCAVPPGLSRWSRDTADRWLEQMCQAHGMELDRGDAQAAGDGGWTALPDGGDLRAVVLRAGHEAPAAAPLRRCVRLLRHDDLLVVADGFGNTAPGEAELQRAMDTLRRTR